MGGDTQVKTEEDLLRYKPVMLFGRDVMEIACFRGSFICGICTGVVGGLGTFLFTSKALFSTHLAFASIWIGVFAYWIPCRYKFETSLLELEIAKKQYLENLKNQSEVGKSEE